MEKNFNNGLIMFTRMFEQENGAWWSPTTIGRFKKGFHLPCDGLDGPRVQQSI